MYVTPIYKKGDCSQPSNYWPISFTSIKHILSSHTTKYLEDYNILNKHQHGFRQKRSCETQLISLFHDLSHSYANDIQIDLISLDLGKAFDTIAHQRLLYKVQHTRKSASMD